MLGRKLNKSIQRAARWRKEKSFAAGGSHFSLCLCWDTLIGGCDLMAIGFLFDYACGCDVFVSYDTILGKDIFIQVLRQSGTRRWHGPCDSRRCRSGKVPASAVFPCGGSKPFQVSLRCPAKAPRSLPCEGLGRGRAGTRRALARITRSARLAPALPFRRLEAFEVFAFWGRPWLVA